MLVIAKNDFVFAMLNDSLVCVTSEPTTPTTFKTFKSFILLNKTFTHEKVCNYTCFANNKLGYFNLYFSEIDVSFIILE